MFTLHGENHNKEIVGTIRISIRFNPSPESGLQNISYTRTTFLPEFVNVQPIGCQHVRSSFQEILTLILGDPGYSCEHVCCMARCHLNTIPVVDTPRTGLPLTIKLNSDGLEIEIEGG